MSRTCPAMQEKKLWNGPWPGDWWEKGLHVQSSCPPGEWPRQGHPRTSYLRMIPQPFGSKLFRFKIPERIRSGCAWGGLLSDPVSGLIGPSFLFRLLRFSASLGDLNSFTLSPFSFYDFAWTYRSALSWISSISLLLPPFLVVSLSKILRGHTVPHFLRFFYPLSSYLLGFVQFSSYLLCDSVSFSWCFLSKILRGHIVPHFLRFLFILPSDLF